MPVLLLAQGDPQAKELLRKAIQARYALRPPVLESVRVELKGRVRARIGPLGTWVPVEASAQFAFPRSMRWDFIVRAVGVPLGSGVEAFDGTTYRHARGSKEPAVVTDEAAIHSLQRRLWAVAAVFLTPLGDHFVRLTATGERQLEACNTQIDGAVNLFLRPDHSLDYVEVGCLNPDTEREQMFSLRLSEEQATVNDMILPSKISSFWDQEPYFEVEPVVVEANPPIPDGAFRLEN